MKLHCLIFHLFCFCRINNSDVIFWEMVRVGLILGIYILENHLRLFLDDGGSYLRYSSLIDCILALTEFSLVRVLLFVYKS